MLFAWPVAKGVFKPKRKMWSPQRPQANLNIFHNTPIKFTGPMAKGVMSQTIRRDLWRMFWVESSKATGKPLHRICLPYKFAVPLTKARWTQMNSPDLCPEAC